MADKKHGVTASATGVKFNRNYGSFGEMERGVGKARRRFSTSRKTARRQGRR